MLEIARLAHIPQLPLVKQVRVSKDTDLRKLKMKPGAPYQPDSIDHDAHEFPRRYSTYYFLLLKLRQCRALLCGHERCYLPVKTKLCHHQ